ncbi:hypothetical protein ACET73_19075 [Aeromonas veronii]
MNSKIFSERRSSELQPVLSNVSRDGSMKPTANDALCLTEGVQMGKLYQQGEHVFRVSDSQPMTVRVADTKRAFCELCSPELNRAENGPQSYALDEISRDHPATL